MNFLFSPMQAKPISDEGNFQERGFVFEFLQKQNLRQGFECTELIWEAIPGNTGRWEVKGRKEGIQ